MSDPDSTAAIELQWPCLQKPEYPSAEQIIGWAQCALSPQHKHQEATIRFVGTDEMQAANREWRGIDKPTNVLSFPADYPAEAGIYYLGDMLVCADVLQVESEAQNKTLHAHWAHIIVHGMLHLQGHDHIDSAEALIMEAAEIRILKDIGYNNPYELQDREAS